MTPSVVVVGAGPRGTGFLERLAANAPSLYGNQPLDVHVVDPFPPGGGRIWRQEQSPLLWMNSMAADVTMFTDDSVHPLDGPVRPGPTLAEWAGIDPQSFPSRRAQGEYLRWVYREAVAALPPGTTVHEHRTRAVRISGPAHGHQRVRLEGRGEPLVADLVVLTVGHLDARPDKEQAGLSDFAARHGLTHLPPGFTADSDLSVLRAGEPVIVRGFGLAFIDLMVLLTEGRGGRYDAAGEYLPSGREPLLYVGSRRGVPYHSKIGYPLTGERPPLPRFFGPGQVDALLARPGPLDFRRDVRPLVERELGFAHYHRLFTAHPERTAVDWADFEATYAAAGAGSAELAALIETSVPDPADRLDLEALDHPLDGVRHASHDALQNGLRAYITEDLARRHDPSHSADLGFFLGLLSVYGQLARLGDTGKGGARWHSFFSHLASGPPGPRLRSLLALSRAGLVRFIGAGITVETDETDGVFRAGGAGAPGVRIEARALVEARLPEPSLERTRSPLLTALYEDGARTTSGGLLVVDPVDGRIVERGTGPHPRRFALGPYTTARSAGAFARPHTNAPAFRQNDVTARTALTLLKESTS
ncbi:FAD/NAD(P)-binding domain-containing protein [Streptomyces sp. NBC_01500]|uniref:FAD/NAD(P)-binding protein n=1 Tax=Streptomyces sp. NBC_01500 TaxID=2903886 RepID=UPI002254063F|nr:FAD/NAD(P)-binding protein [Streptomyces sp. NBC_01500]MCX4551976.1 FAD/NAD(P)-binding protein [Streptomyces sp. NBC_01500]